MPPFVRPLLLLASLMLPLATAETVTATLDISRDELAIYQRLNLHRTERRQGDNTVSSAIRRKQITARLQVWNHQNGSVTAVPPVVFNPVLNRAAHALLAAGVKPVTGEPNEIAGTLTQLGYQPTTDAILLLAVDAPSLDLAYLQALTQEVGRLMSKANKPLDPLYSGTGIHRAEQREVGIAVNGGKDRWSLAIVLANGSAKRLIGGVAYLDANHNRRCDPGEGVAGVQVTAGGSSTTTVAGGPWWLPLSVATEGTVLFSQGAVQMSLPLAAAAQNTLLDWRLPNPADLAVADRLLADCAKLPANGDPEQNRKPLAALLTGTRMLALDAAREQRVTTLTAPIRSEYEAAVAKVLSLLGEEPEVFKPQFVTLQRRWPGAMPAWFKEAEGLYRVKRQTSAVLTAPPEQQEKLRTECLAQITKAVATSTDPAFIAMLDTLQQQVSELVPEPSAKPAKAGKDKPAKK